MSLPICTTELPQKETEAKSKATTDDKKKWSQRIGVVSYCLIISQPIRDIYLLAWILNETYL
jgi:hypothetical protein